MRELSFLLSLLLAAAPAQATSYLMDWTATGTGQRVNGGPGGYTENITVGETGHGSFTIDDSQLGGRWQDYLTAFTLTNHIIETDVETAPGFSNTYTLEGNVGIGLADLLNFTFAAGTSGGSPVIGFVGGSSSKSVVGEFITGTNGVFTSTVRPQDVTTHATLTVLPAAAIPEPAAWATMLCGFGLVGAGLRQRKSIARTI